MAATADNSGQWMSPAEAATVLGVSVRTLRRRITSGELRQQREHGRVLIWLPMAAIVPEVTATSDNPPPVLSDVSQQVSELAATMGQALATLQHALEEERAERQSALERANQAERAATMYQERARNLEEENAKLAAQLALPPPAPEQRSWWQRWRRG